MSTTADPDVIMDGMASIETAELTVHGLKKAFGKELKGSVSGVQPFIMHWLISDDADPQTQGGYELEGTVWVSGERVYESDFAGFLAVGPESEPDEVSSAKVAKWPRKIDRAYLKHTTLGNLVRKAEYTGGRTASMPIGGITWRGWLYTVHVRSIDTPTIHS